MLPVNFPYLAFGGILLLNDLAMGAFAAPLNAAVIP